ncbi:helix-turn-helix domain-containing protein [Weissella confusa]
MRISNDMLTALKRKRGELNITVLEMAAQTGVSRWTLDKLLRGEKDDMKTGTVRKLSEWLYKLI